MGTESYFYYSCIFINKERGDTKEMEKRFEYVIKVDKKTKSRQRSGNSVANQEKVLVCTWR